LGMQYANPLFFLINGFKNLLKKFIALIFVYH
jgi:hypothetical protein